jgi:intein/homing endonuclease
MVVKVVKPNTDCDEQWIGTPDHKVMSLNPEVEEKKMNT